MMTVAGTYRQCNVMLVEFSEVWVYTHTDMHALHNCDWTCESVRS